MSLTRRLVMDEQGSSIHDHLKVTSTGIYTDMQGNLWYMRR